ncbi:MAG: VOC family protein [Alphaproteobacteria bacterium]|nr:VOC family protein [Alphaproteobacteria bacterium]
MLGDSILQAIVTTARPDASRAFYTETLGLKLLEDNQFGFVVAGQIGFLRVAKLTTMIPSPNAVAGFMVADVAKTAADLAAKGVALERFAFLQHDAAGLWTAPDGSKIGWFRDPDLNLLSISQRPKV